MTGPEFIPPPAAQPQRRLLRSRTNRVWAGVCGGVAEYLGGDATFVRLGTVILALISGIIPMLILYVIAAAVVPERVGGAEDVGRVYAQPDFSWLAGRGVLIVGAILIVAGVLGLAREFLRIDWNLLWPVVLIGLGVAILLAIPRERQSAS